MLAVETTLKSQLNERTIAARPTPMRVGFVMHVMQVAGAEVLVKQIIERLSDHIEATVFCLDALGELGQQLLDAGVPVIVLDRQPGFDRSVARKLANEVRTRKIEVLHAHQYTPFFYSALARLMNRAPCKIIFTEHGRHYPDIVSWKRRWANRLLLNRYAEIATACCDFSAEAVRSVEGFPKTFTLPNGVDLAELPPRGTPQEQTDLRGRLGLDVGRPYAACVARLHPVKDHATLIRAWAKVHAALPDAKLLLVGDGPERKSIEQLIAELSQHLPRPLAGEVGLSGPGEGSSTLTSSTLASSFEFWGIRHDVGDILRAVDVFTLTSVSEAASLTLLEAMASQCACVVTDVGGNGEHLRQGIEGYLVPRADDSQLAVKLIELLSEPSAAQNFGTAARLRVQEKFNLVNSVALYREHYEQLASLGDVR
jgi:L-malate glycosyltransferase